MAQRIVEPYVEEGIDALTLLTPLVENWRPIFFGATLIATAVGGWAAIKPRQYKAEMMISPVISTRTPQALGGLAALAGATLQAGYQLTPARMVEFLKSRAVLSGVGFSPVRPPSSDRVVDRVLGEHFEPTDAETVARQIAKLMDVATNKETGTISLAVSHKDSALARIIATRIVDRASNLFVSTSRAQAQQLRESQEARVANAAAKLEQAEEAFRQFNFANRSTPAYSVAGMDRERLNRQIRFAEQVYTQAMTDRDAAYARELEATPTVVIQDPLPADLPKVRKRIIIKTAIALVTSFVVLCIVVILADVTRRRLARRDMESERFRAAVGSLPRVGSS